MKYFEYLYYRMHEAYSKKNDSPTIRASLYLAVCFFTLIILFILFLESLFLSTHLYPSEKIVVIKNSYVFWIIIFVLIFVITYYGFTKKHFSYYQKRFGGWQSLNGSIKIWMILNIPFLFLFLGLIINFFLFGGEVFGVRIDGLFG